VSSSATASAPASSANLGPGFDTLALALELRCTVSAEPSEMWSIEHTGSHRPSGPDADGVLFAARKAVGEHRPLKLSVKSDIPLGKGLGSSAAAFTAGVAAAMQAVGDEPSPGHVYRVASELEGHPDNVAASVYGGLVLVPAEGMPIRLPLHPSIHVVVGVSGTSLSTAQARSSVPSEFPRPLVVRSLARIAALTAGLISADPLLLAAAHGDEIHEQSRSSLSPEVDRLIRRVRNAGAWHAARSGAGPAVIAIAGLDYLDEVTKAFESEDVQALPLAVATTGLLTGVG
jgi:homoserine kinase